MFINTDIVIEFDPVVYGPITEGLGQSITFRIVAIGAVVSDIEVLFNTVDGTAICMLAMIIL